jgi:antitoxin component YwqK of YwqJK toxin-antitoxin module
MKTIVAICAVWAVCIMPPAAEWTADMDEEYLNYAIPKDAVSSERTARPGFQYVVYVTYKVGNAKVGVRYYWDNDKTKIHSEELVKDGKKHGLQREWYENGQLKSESPFKDGEMNGKFKQWSPSGKLLGVSVMTAGTGTWKTWYPSGRPEYVKPFKAGKPDGEQKIYFDTGKLQQTITYKDGEPHGISKIWDRNGNLVEGSPLYYIRGDKVAKENYEKACATDESLPRIPPDKDK